jgi:hypothetical protein
MSEIIQGRQGRHPMYSTFVQCDRFEKLNESGEKLNETIEKFKN